jgi:hypothetical protein
MMVNNLFKRGFVWLLLIIVGLTFFGCDLLNSNKNNDDNNGLPSTSGSLTVTGLNNFEGQYAVYTGTITDFKLYGLTELTSDSLGNIHKGAQIVNGEITLNIYKLQEGKLFSYGGTETTSLGGLFLSGANEFRDGRLQTTGWNIGLNNITFTAGIATVEK